MLYGKENKYAGLFRNLEKKRGQDGRDGLEAGRVIEGKINRYEQVRYNIK